MRSIPSAKSLLMWGLIALNAFLLALAVNRYIKPNAAMAQAAPAMVPGDYLTAPGMITGQSDGVVFVLDTRNGLLSIMSYNSTSGAFAATPPIDVNRVLAAGAGAVGGGPTPTPHGVHH